MDSVRSFPMDRAIFFVKIRDQRVLSKNELFFCQVFPNGVFYPGKIRKTYLRTFSEFKVEKTKIAFFLMDRAIFLVRKTLKKYSIK